MILILPCFSFCGNFAAVRDDGDDTELLTLISSSKCSEMPDINIEVLDEESVDEVMETDSFQVNTYCQSLSRFSKMTVTYIAGHVVRKLQNTLNCQPCLSALQVPGGTPEGEREIEMYALLERKNEFGKLIYASSDAIQVCLETEKVVKACIVENQGKPPNLSNLLQKLVNRSIELVSMKSP